MLLEHVLEPARQGQPVAYSPLAWQAWGREEAITVPPGCRKVLLEGVGAAHRELLPVIDIFIWVQSEMKIAQHGV